MDEAVTRYLAEIGRKGRAANTAAQRAAAKRNGKKGGRPPGAKDNKPRKRGPNQTKGKK